MPVGWSYFYTFVFYVIGFVEACDLVWLQNMPKKVFAAFPFTPAALQKQV